MADLVITTTGVNGVIGGNQYDDGIGNAAITIGQTCYQNPTDSYWYPALASSTAAASGTTNFGIALSTIVAAGQPVRIFISGTISPGCTGMSVGQTYVLSANSGKIAPVSDLTTNNYVTVIGVAISASQIETPTSGALASGALHF